MTDWSLDEFLDGGGEGYTVDVPIKPRALVKKHADLERAILERSQEGGSLAGDDLLRQMAAGLQELEDRIDERTKVYSFRAVSRRRWRDLLAKHPPAKKDRDAGHDFNPDTFPAAAIAACCVSPKMTEDEAKQLEDDDELGTGGFEQLWNGCLAVNLGVVNDTPKSVLATAILRTNAASSTTAANGESRAASS